MGELTTDRNDPLLGHGPDKERVPQNQKYLVMSDEQIDEGFINPVIQTYTHLTCGTDTTMSLKIAETYAANPSFYRFTYCVHCGKHLPVNEFVWKGTDQKVGSYFSHYPEKS